MMIKEEGFGLEGRALEMSMECLDFWTALSSGWTVESHHY